MRSRLLHIAVTTPFMAVALSGCGQRPQQPSAEAKEMARAHRAATEQLRDPQSAQFRKERLITDKKLVCGEVNAKNAYGGYAGFAPYIFYISTGQVRISPGDPDFAALNGFQGSITSPIAKQNIDQVADACAFQIEWVEKCESKRPSGWGNYKKSCESIIKMRPTVDAISGQ